MTKSSLLFERAKQHIPSGVNSPVRAFRAVGGTPLFIQRAKGAYVWDEDGRRYLDFVMSWGPLILGHAESQAALAVARQAKRGTTYGAPTRNEVLLAELIKSAFPSIEQLRLVSSGTEAVMSAVRLARGVTGKSVVVKCDGCYHGHVDSLLVQAGSGAATFGVPDSRGVPGELAKLTYSIPYNDIGALEWVFEAHSGKIACFILEPVPANMGLALPQKGYLQKVRALTRKHGVLLIFDEVVTGFRLALGGAQEFFGVTPDLTCLGKVVGGGLPIGAFGGRKALMAQLAPEGPVYQAGTLSGNPIATAAGIATLRQLKAKDFYKKLNDKSARFFEQLTSEISKHSLPVTVNSLGSCFTIFFTESKVVDFQSAKRARTDRYAQLFHKLLNAGIYLTPSQFEANFISSAHTAAELSASAKIISRTIQTL